MTLMTAEIFISIANLARFANCPRFKHHSNGMHFTPPHKIYMHTGNGEERGGMEGNFAAQINMLFILSRTIYLRNYFRLGAIRTLNLLRGIRAQTNPTVIMMWLIVLAWMIRPKRVLIPGYLRQRQIREPGIKIKFEIMKRTKIYNDLKTYSIKGSDSIK